MEIRSNTLGVIIAIVIFGGIMGASALGLWTTVSVRNSARLQLSKLARRWCVGASPRRPQRRARFRQWGFHPTVGRGWLPPPCTPWGLTPPLGAG